MAEPSLELELCAVSEREKPKSALVSTSFNAPTFKAFSTHYDKISPLTFKQQGHSARKVLPKREKDILIKIHNGTVDVRTTLHSPILS